MLSQNLRQRFLIPEDEVRQGSGDEVRASQGNGYGIVRFDKSSGRVTVECWPCRANPARADKQHKGWPKSVSFDELDGRTAVAWLPDLDLSEMPESVVQVIDQATGETVKSTRVRAKTWSPGVFTAGAVYNARVGLPEKNLWWTAKDLRPGTQKGAARLRARLRQ